MLSDHARWRRFRGPQIGPLLPDWGGITRDGGDLQFTIFFKSAICPE
jgi:hypothetical protein